MLIRQEDRRLAEGPREPVVALLHPTGIELATRIRLFPTGAGLGVGVLRRRSHAPREALAEQLMVKQATACGHLLLW